MWPAAWLWNKEQVWEGVSIQPACYIPSLTNACPCRSSANYFTQQDPWSFSAHPHSTLYDSPQLDVTQKLTPVHRRLSQNHTHIPNRHQLQTHDPMPTPNHLCLHPPQRPTIFTFHPTLKPIHPHLRNWVCANAPARSSGQFCVTGHIQMHAMSYPGRRSVCYLSNRLVHDYLWYSSFAFIYNFTITD